jgi:serine/threonine-protein phosphatase 4 regulatory subunit 1
LDDELTYAARQSAMNRNNAQKAAENDSTVEDSKDPSLVISSNENDPNTDKQSNIENSNNQNKKEEDNDNNEDNNDDDLDYMLPENITDLSGDAQMHDQIYKKFDIYNIDSAEKGEVESNKNSDTKNNGQDIVPQELINYYVSMADPEQCVDMGAEIPHHCAFSFPAVTLTLGRENWPYLKKAYQSLSSAKHWKVRHTLASSIHEIAMILGEELTVTDLMPIYDGFIKDLDEVRIGVLKHLATFLKLLKPVDRSQYLPRLGDFLATDNEWNWRFREELAMQLLETVPLFSPSDVAQSIAPLSLQLLLDKIAAVRNIALKLVKYLLRTCNTVPVIIPYL